MPFLLTTSSLACGASGCGHLCITITRMRRHWATVHSDVVVCRNSSTAASQPGRNSKLGNEASSLEIDTLEVVSLCRSNNRCVRESCNGGQTEQEPDADVNIRQAANIGVLAVGALEHAGYGREEEVPI
jgi:hypothetical protein